MPPEFAFFILATPTKVIKLNKLTKWIKNATKATINNKSIKTLNLVVQKLLFLFSFLDSDYSVNFASVNFVCSVIFGIFGSVC